MKVTFPLALLSCYIIHSGAQGLPEILQNKPLKEGIYLSFDEFLRNAPSVTTDFQLTLKGSEKKLEKGVGDYRLLLFDSVKTNIRSKNIWGVSDGANVFINEWSYSGIHNFKRIHRLGRYCYFRGSIPSEQRGNVPPSLIGFAAIELAGDYGYVLNINNGKVFALGPDVMRLILKKDSVLSVRYEQEQKKRNPETMFSYLDQYNQKYWMEASRDYLEPIDVIVYRTGKKEKEESFQVVINDTLDYEMKPNAYYSFSNMTDAIKLCLVDNCFDIPLAKKRVNYIRCSWDKRGQPGYEKVDSEAGAFYSRMAKVLSDRENGE